MEEGPVKDAVWTPVRVRDITGPLGRGALPVRHYTCCRKRIVRTTV